ncbi:MAG: BolA family protein [Bdellovibrionales bacterium]
MSRTNRIIEKLTAALQPVRLDVRDISHLHAGHAGAGDGKNETHFTISIDSPALAGKSRVQQHRAINDLLADEFASGLHALSIHILG